MMRANRRMRPGAVLGGADLAAGRELADGKAGGGRRGDEDTDKHEERIGPALRNDECCGRHAEEQRRKRRGRPCSVSVPW